jgi:hypothetical protein
LSDLSACAHADADASSRAEQIEDAGLMARSAWSHLLCRSCWRLLQPNEDPHRFQTNGIPEELLQCCHCGAPAKDVWLRMDPKEMNCEGSGGVHEELE